MESPFRISVYSKDFNHLGWVDAPVAQSWTPRHNQQGNGSIIVQTGSDADALLGTVGARAVVKFKDGFLMSGPVRSYRVEGKGKDRLTTYQVEDDFRLLSRMLLWPDSDNEVWDQEREQRIFSGPAETVLKNFLTENLARLEETRVTIAPSLGRGGFIRYGARFHTSVEDLIAMVDQAGVGVTVRQIDGELVVDCYEATLSEDSVSVGSYNIVFRTTPTDTDWMNSRRHAVAADIVDSGADVIGLQESFDSFRDQTGELLEALHLASVIDWKIIKSERYQSFAYNPLTVRPIGKPITTDTNVVNLRTGRQRAIASCLFESLTSGTRFWVVNTHFPTASNVPEGALFTHADMIQEAAQRTLAVAQNHARSGEPTYIVGDFNHDTIPRSTFIEGGFDDIRLVSEEDVPGVDYNSFNGYDPMLVGRQDGRWIDGIYVKNSTVTQGGLFFVYANTTSLPLRTPMGSDHFMVFADVVLKRPTSATNQTLSEEAGTLVDVAWSRNAPSCTRVVVGGAFEGVEREFFSMENVVLEEEWGDFIEEFVDGGSVSGEYRSAFDAYVRAAERLKEEQIDRGEALIKYRHAIRAVENAKRKRDSAQVVAKKNKKSSKALSAYNKAVSAYNTAVTRRTSAKNTYDNAGDAFTEAAEKADEAMLELQDLYAEYLENIAALGETALAAGVAKAGFSINLQESESLAYGGADGLKVGDLVTVDVGGNTITDVIRSCTLSLSTSAGYTVTPVVGAREDVPLTRLTSIVSTIKRGVHKLRVR